MKRIHMDRKFFKTFRIALLLTLNAVFNFTNVNAVRITEVPINEAEVLVKNLNVVRITEARDWWQLESYKQTDQSIMEDKDYAARPWFTRSYFLPQSNNLTVNCQEMTDLLSKTCNKCHDCRLKSGDWLGNLLCFPCFLLQEICCIPCCLLNCFANHQHDLLVKHSDQCTTCQAQASEVNKWWKEIQLPTIEKCIEDRRTRDIAADDKRSEERAAFNKKREADYKAGERQRLIDATDRNTAALKELAREARRY